MDKKQIKNYIMDAYFRANGDITMGIDFKEDMIKEKSHIGENIAILSFRSNYKQGPVEFVVIPGNVEIHTCDQYWNFKMEY